MDLTEFENTAGAFDGDGRGENLDEDDDVVSNKIIGIHTKIWSYEFALNIFSSLITQVY